MSLERHTFCSALKDPRLSVDPAGVLNQRPLAQQTGAYPAELTGRQKMTMTLKKHRASYLNVVWPVFNKTAF